MAVIKNFSYHYGSSCYSNEWLTALADKRMWEFKALQSFWRIPCQFLPTQDKHQHLPYFWKNEGKTTSDNHSSSLWNAVRLLGFLRFAHSLCSDVSCWAPKRPEPPRQPAAPEPGPHQPTKPASCLPALCGHLPFEAVEHDRNQLLARQACFLGHWEANSLTNGWS